MSYCSSPRSQGVRQGIKNDVEGRLTCEQLHAEGNTLLCYLPGSTIQAKDSMLSLVSMRLN